jgi:hypothetical protein
MYSAETAAIQALDGSGDIFAFLKVDLGRLLILVRRVVVVRGRVGKCYVVTSVYGVGTSWNWPDEAALR